jgi:hypothetical protein
MNLVSLKLDTYVTERINSFFIISFLNCFVINLIPTFYINLYSEYRETCTIFKYYLYICDRRGNAISMFW